MELREQLQCLGLSYTIERELGGGGMSRVFVADGDAPSVARSSSRSLPPDLAGGVNVERFKREIQLAAQLQHPHIVPVLAAGEIDGVPYYTMPFVEGESLRERHRARPDPIAERSACCATSRARSRTRTSRRRPSRHQAGQRPVVRRRGAVADFGIAKAHQRRGHANAGGRAGEVARLRDRHVDRNAAYMAPEQAAADPDTDHRADIYSFGCLAYEMLTGRPPFIE